MMSIKNGSALAIGCIATLGCSSGNWVDAPMACGTVNEALKEGKEKRREKEAVEFAADWMKMQGQGTCGHIGKVYTGDYDCNDGKSRVKCK